jgi:hypothetical protein
MGDGRVDAEERRRELAEQERRDAIYDAFERFRRRREESRDEEMPRESAQEAYCRQQDDYWEKRQ